jgi:hypothetical protein
MREHNDAQSLKDQRNILGSNTSFIVDSEPRIGHEATHDQSRFNQVCQWRFGRVMWLVIV